MLSCSGTLTLWIALTFVLSGPWVALTHTLSPARHRHIVLFPRLPSLPLAHPGPHSLTLCAHLLVHRPSQPWQPGTLAPSFPSFSCPPSPLCTLLLASSLHTHPHTPPTRPLSRALTLSPCHSHLPCLLSSSSLLSSFHLPHSPALPPSTFPPPCAHRPLSRIPSLSSHTPSLSCPPPLPCSSHMLPRIPSI